MNVLKELQAFRDNYREKEPLFQIQELTAEEQPAKMAKSFWKDNKRGLFCFQKEKRRYFYFLDDDKSVRLNIDYNTYHLLIDPGAEDNLDNYADILLQEIHYQNRLLVACNAVNEQYYWFDDLDYYNKIKEECIQRHNEYMKLYLKSQGFETEEELMKVQEQDLERYQQEYVEKTYQLVNSDLPRIIVELTRSSEELKKLRLKGFVWQGLQETVLQWEHKFNWKNEEEKEFFIGFPDRKVQHVRFPPIGEYTKYVALLESVDEKAAIDFFGRLQVFFIENVSNWFKKKDLDWQEFINISVEMKKKGNK